MITADSLPDDIATLKALVLAGQAALADAEIARLTAESKARNLEAEVRARTLLIEQMKFTIAKLKHEQYGQSSERSRRMRAHMLNAASALDRYIEAHTSAG